MAKGLSLKNIQKELDFKKWNISQIEKQDMSGRMEYCGYCPYQLNGLSCKAEQSERETKTLCAVAFRNKKQDK